MGFKQIGETVIARATMACDLGTRILSSGASWLRDTYLQNAYVEFNPDDNSPYVVKRPALQPGFTAGSTTLVTGQGLFNYPINGVLILFAIVANTLYRLTGGTIAHGSASGATWISQTPSPALNISDQGTSSAIVFHNQIMIIGGYQSSLTKYTANITSTSDGNTWTTITNSPQWAATGGGRANPNLAVLHDSLYLMNGTNTATSGLTLNDCWYSANGVDWSQATADMGSSNGIFPRFNATTVTFNGNILMIGGSEVTANGVATLVNTVVSSPNGVNWTKNATPAFTARKTAAVVFKNSIYCVGGTDAVNDLEQVYKSTDGNTWTSIYSTGFGGTGKHFFSVVVLGNLMYAFADTSNGGTSRAIYSSPDGATWTLLATPPWAAGQSLQAVVFQPPLNYTGYPQYPADVIWVVNPNANAVYFTDLDTNYATSYAIGTGAAVTAQYETITMNLYKYLVIKNNTDAWYYTANTVNKIVDQNYPGATVRGIVNLASRAYVMDTLGNIRGSKINDPTVWPPLNFERADFTGDDPVCIAQYSNYIVAFKTRSMMFFAVNGKSVGNTISPQQNANARVGCGQAYSVVEMANTVFFMSTYGGLRRSISKLNGFVPEKVSTDDVDRILDGNPCTNVDSFSLKMGGEEFYILNLRDAPTASLIYDNSTTKWAIWSSGADGVTTGTLPFRVSNRTGLGQKTYGQDHQTNGVFEITDTSFQDVDQSAVTTAITTIIQPDKSDGGTHQPKFCASIDIIGDNYATANGLVVEVSDDDGQTFTNLGTADLTSEQPYVNLGGRFFRRIHRFTHTANNPLRIQAYEITIEPGDV
jgi:hypothetical protein